MLFATGVIQAAPHHRAASHPSGCALTIAPRAVELPAAGGAASVSVGATGQCAWTATSNAAWITTSTTNNSVVITVQPSTQSRSATVDIGGFSVVVVQDAPTNLLTNGGFDQGLNAWATTYSTGAGAVRWVVGDNGGAAEITSQQPLTGYQLLQCVDVTPGTTIDAGARVLIPSGQDASGSAVLGVYELQVADCTNTAYSNGWRITVKNTGAWTRMDETIPLQPNTLSVLFVIGGGGEKVAPFSVDYDDAYVRVH